MREKIAPDMKPDATERARRTDETDRKATDTYKILDVRAEDVVLEMEDGRAFVATLGEGLNEEDVKRNRMAVITSDGMDRSEAPKSAVVTRIAPKE